MRLRDLWRKAFPVRETLIAVPVGFEKPVDGKLDADPRFMREMAESMAKCPVVYENMNAMLKRRAARLQVPAPTTTQAARDTDEWEKKQAAIEAALLRLLLSGPSTCAQAINDLAKRKTAIQASENENWTLERTE